MSFLEMTKLHLARQEKAKLDPGIRKSGGLNMCRIIWKSETIIIFQDFQGHFRRYLCDSQICLPAVIRSKSN